jgi:peroxiredoxin Q/BCP
MKTKLTKTIQKKALQCTDQSITCLGDLADGWYVLYFYPKDNTPGCTQEAKDFTVQLKKFAKLDCDVIGLSRDSLKSHHKFIEKIAINHPLISDEDETLCNYFETLKEKNMYGRKYMGIERSTFLIDPDGNIAHSWRKVKVPGHVDEVFATAKELISG